jgi:hypothetical protein
MNISASRTDGRLAHGCNCLRAREGLVPVPSVLRQGPRVVVSPREPRRLRDDVPSRGETGFRLAQTMQFGPHTSVGVQRLKAEVGPTSGPTVVGAFLTRGRRCHFDKIDSHGSKITVQTPKEWQTATV